MTKEPFIAHSEMTNEIYIICGREKYPVTEQVIKAMQNTGRLEQPTSEDCVSRQAVIEIIKKSDACLYEKSDNDGLIEEIKTLSPVTPIHCIAAVRFSKEDLKNICDERIEIECTHGTCKDCENFCCLNGIMPTCKKYFRRVTEDFYCADFEKRVNENG